MSPPLELVLPQCLSLSPLLSSPRGPAPSVPHVTLRATSAHVTRHVSPRHASRQPVSRVTSARVTRRAVSSVSCGRRPAASPGHPAEHSVTACHSSAESDGAKVARGDKQSPLLINSPPGLHRLPAATRGYQQPPPATRRRPVQRPTKAKPMLRVNRY